MRVGIDVSQAIYQTGVSDYVINLVRHLPSDILTLVGFSLRRRKDLTHLFPECVTYPIPPTLLHYLWNRLHVLNFENFTPGKIDIYHSSDWVQAPASSAKVTTVHDLAPLLFPSEHDPKLVSVHAARLRWVAIECDRIICVSQNTASDMIRLYPKTKDKTVVIPEALPQRFVQKPKKSPFFDYIVCIGARQPRKNIPRLVSSYVKFKKKYHLPSKLVIVGETGDRIAHPDVVYTGHVPDAMLVALLASADVFVYPSLYEGFGLPILGAFYHKVPVACSNTSSLPEVAGQAASYFDPIDEESIAQGIFQAIKNRRHLIASGTDQVSKFSWENTARQTLKVYRSLL